MTDKTKASLRRGALWLAPFLLSVTGYGAQRYDASLMKVPRFVTDSSVFMTEDAAFKREVRQSLQDIKDGQSAINLRLTQINCGDAVRKGCR